MNRGEDEGAFWDLLFNFVVDSPIDCFGFANKETPGTGATSHPNVN